MRLHCRSDGHRIVWQQVCRVLFDVINDGFEYQAVTGAIGMNAVGAHVFVEVFFLQERSAYVNAADLAFSGDILHTVGIAFVPPVDVPDVFEPFEYTAAFFLIAVCEPFKIVVRV